MGAVLGTTWVGEEKRGRGEDLILIEYQRGSGEEEEDGTNALYGACEL